MRSAGTHLYFLDPDTGGCTAVQVGCPTSITGLDSTIEQVEITCLDDRARRYESGLATPGTATFTLTLDPQDYSHSRLLELKKAGTTLQWAIGLPESEAVPTGSENTDGECVFDLPTSRTWVTFEGFVNSYPFDFPLAGLITVTIGVQVSGDPDMIPATT